MKRKSLVSDYIELTKPRVTLLVLVTAALGFYLGGKGLAPVTLLGFLLMGTALVAGGASALNHCLECEFDSKMRRTKDRPIPAGRILPGHALNFGVMLIMLGISILYVKVNILTAFLSLLTAFLYIMVYTPMKRVSWLNTTVGAVPGAIPPLGGWAAATGGLCFEAGMLFLILFLWQHPHFYCIAWMRRDDYRRGGFKMLPVVEPDGKRTFGHILWFSGALIPVSLIPAVTGASGMIYAVGVLLTGVTLLVVSRGFALSRAPADAQRLLRATVLYLPVLFLLMAVDVLF